MLNLISKQLYSLNTKNLHSDREIGTFKISVEGYKLYTVSGSFSKLPSSRNKLVMCFNIQENNQINANLMNLMYSKVVGIFTYINPQESKDFSITFRAPFNVKTIEVSLLRWQNDDIQLNNQVVVEEYAEQNKLLETYQTITLGSINDFKIIYDKTVIYRLFIDGIPYEFMTRFNRKSDRCIISANSATKRKYPLPIIQKHSLIEKFKDSTIVFHDPTLYLNKSLMCGWYTGSEHHYCFDKIYHLINHIIPNQFEYNKILFLGSSASGYFAMRMAAFFPESIALVTNPQTDIFKFNRKIVNQLLDISYHDLSYQEIADKYIERFSLIEFFKTKNYFPNIYYRQNIQDPMHYRRHFLPLLDFYKSLSSNNKKSFYIEIYNHNDGHYAISPIQTMLKEIDTAFSVFDKNTF